MAMQKKIDGNEFISEFGHSLLFEHLSFQETQEILNDSFIKTVYEGEYLIHEGDEPSYLFFIMEGALITYRTNDSGDEVSIRLLGRGESCMDAVIFMGSTQSPIGVKATTPTVVLKIPTVILKKCVYKNHELANNMLNTVAKYYGESLVQIDNLAIKGAKESVGHYLLRQFIDNNERQTSFVLKFKKIVIANYLGIKPETLSRMLKELKKEGTIDMRGDKVILKDEFVLCDFCDVLTKKACANSVSMDCSKRPT